MELAVLLVDDLRELDADFAPVELDIMRRLSCELKVNN